MTTLKSVYYLKETLKYMSEIDQSGVYKIRFENAGMQTVVECGYDSQGRRFEKKVTVAGTTTLHHRYIYRGYLQIAALDLTRAAHPALWLVTWDPTQPTATRPLALQKDGTWFTYGYDITKNVCELFGPNGYIRTTYSYTPFGSVSASENGVVQNFQWSSEYYDSELDLVYYNYLHYSPSLGRFLSRDPIAEQGGLNLYAFVGNSPIIQTDSLGNEWFPDRSPWEPMYCCGNQPYRKSSHCCLEENGNPTLISVGTEDGSGLFYVEMRGRWGIPGLLQHAWLEADYIQGGAAGFYPSADGQPISLPGQINFGEDDKRKEYPKWEGENRTKSKIEIKLSSCIYDLKKFKSCVPRRINEDSKKGLNYIVLLYRDCEIWANDVISDCKKEAKRS